MARHKNQQELLQERRVKQREAEIKAFREEVEMMELIYRHADVAPKLESERFKEGMELIEKQKEEQRKEQVEALKAHNKPKLDVDPDTKEPVKATKEGTKPEIVSTAENQPVEPSKEGNEPIKKDSNPEATKENLKIVE